MTTAKQRERIVLVSSTVDPAYVAELGPRLASFGIALLDAPVSGGPAKAAAGTMTMMVSGDAEAFGRVRTLLDRIAGRVFTLGPRPGDASTFKIVNNMLAAANLAAGAEALALARRRASISSACARSSTRARARAGSSRTAPRARSAATSPREQRCACSTRTWASRPRSRTRLGVDAPFARLATKAFAAAIAAGRGDDDDAVLVRLALDAAARRRER